MKTRVLLADDHIVLLEVLKQQLEPVCDVVGTASDGRLLISLAEKLQPDVIVTDIYMPNLNVLDACHQLTTKAPDSRIIFLTVNEDRYMAEEAIRRGAFGYVLKKGVSEELFKAIRSVVLGRVYITPAITREPVNVFVSRAKNRGNNETITSRQCEVIAGRKENRGKKPRIFQEHKEYRFVSEY
jgi:DNA-binding NarL/FixJ family response regulator